MGKKRKAFDRPDKTKKRRTKVRLFCSGGDGWARTNDLHDVNVAL